MESHEALCTALQNCQDENLPPWARKLLADTPPSLLASLKILTGFCLPVQKEVFVLDEQNWQSCIPFDNWIHGSIAVLNEPERRPQESVCILNTI